MFANGVHWVHPMSLRYFLLLLLVFFFLPSANRIISAKGYCFPNRTDQGYWTWYWCKLLKKCYVIPNPGTVLMERWLLQSCAIIATWLGIGLFALCEAVLKWERDQRTCNSTLNPHMVNAACGQVWIFTWLCNSQELMLFWLLFIKPDSFETVKPSVLLIPGSILHICSSQEARTLASNILGFLFSNFCVEQSISSDILGIFLSLCYFAVLKKSGWDSTLS